MLRLKAKSWGKHKNLTSEYPHPPANRPGERIERMRKNGELSPLDNNIYKILSRQNSSQAELGRKIGVKREYINHIINRKIIPRTPLALKIAKALGVPVEEVFFEE